MAWGTGDYVNGSEVTQNSDGSYNVPGIGVVGTSQSGPTPTADSDAGSIYTENADNYRDYYNSRNGDDSTVSKNTPSIASGLLSGSKSGGFAMGLLPSVSEMINNTMPKTASPSLIPASPTTNPLTGINNNNYFNGTGFAYIDKYGFPHVSNTYETALKYARDATGLTEDWIAGGDTYKIFSNPGQVYEYNGPYGGGYALNKKGSRLALPLPGAVNYGNANRHMENDADSNPETLLLPTSNFQSQYPNYLNFGNTPIAKSYDDTDSKLLARGLDRQYLTQLTSEQKSQLLQAIGGE